MPPIVLVDRQPVGARLLVDRRLGMRRREAGEVPGRIDEGVHGVGLAARFAPAARALDVLPRRMPVERIAWFVEGGVLRQLHRQVGFGHGTVPHASQWMTGIGQPQ
ncbi:MAG: hypothetical protein WDN31_00455 [Hyphomicrobium sp.]